MKRILFIIVLFLSIMACKNDYPDLISEDQEISLLRADFERQTGYDQSKVYLLTPAFRTKVNWDKAVHKSKDTILVSLTVLDTVLYPINGTEVNLKNNVIMKAVRNEKSEWSYATVTFIPTSLEAGYSGLILSRSLTNSIEKTRYFNKGSRVSNSSIIKRKFANTSNKKQALSKLRAGCTYAYVNGILNQVTCTPPDKDGLFDDEDPGGGGGPWEGNPRDYFPPGEGGGAGGTTPPSTAQIQEQIKDKPFALIPNIPCDIVKKWIATAKFAVDQSTWNRLTQIENTIKPGNDNSYLTNIQNINNAYSTVVNMDYFPITVNMMPLVNGKIATPEQFLEHIRKNINSFVDTDYSEFKPYVYSGVNDTNLWNSNNPKNAVVGIDIGSLWGTGILDDNGSVIVSKYNSSGWTFTTIYEPMYGSHPVSGNRDFGFTKNANGSYTFYTRGVDRLTNADGSALERMTRDGENGGIPFQKADALWASFQKGIADYVNTHGGNAGAGGKETYRPDWSAVKDVIDGKAPLSSLSTDCKD